MFGSIASLFSQEISETVQVQISKNILATQWELVKIFPCYQGILHVISLKTVQGDALQELEFVHHFHR